MFLCNSAPAVLSCRFSIKSPFHNAAAEMNGYPKVVNVSVKF